MRFLTICFLTVIITLVISDLALTGFNAVAQGSLNGKLAFTYGGGGNSSTEIYVINADGTGQTRITNNGYDDRFPSWSPDGSKIAFESSNSSGAYNIFVINADGGNQTQLTNSTYPYVNLDPAWSPDGSKIAFVSDRDGSGKSEIWVMNTDGSNPLRLTTSVRYETGTINAVYSQAREPIWSPDGTKIAFSSYRDGNFNLDIYVMKADGSDQTRLTTHPSDDRDPTWSPDGSKIAFTSTRDNNHEIYGMNADGSNQVNLTNYRSGNDFQPAWSPDGAKIAFARLDSTFNRTMALYLMNADGSGQAKLVDNPGDDWTPAWSPLATTPIPTYSISGRVTDASGNGISGVSLNLSGVLVRTTQSDASGNYVFQGLATGAYRIDASKPGYGFNPPSYSISSLTVDQAANFTGYNAYSISGQITAVGGNIITLTLSGSQTLTTETDVSGNYAFRNLQAGGNYSVTPVSPYFSFTPGTQTFNNLSTNQTVVNFAAARATYTISGTIRRAGAGFEGVTVTLDNNSQAVTTTTDANGNYSFANVVAGGSYFVRPSKPNYYFIQPSQYFEQLGAHQVANFTAASMNNFVLGTASIRVGEIQSSIQIPVYRGGNDRGVGTLTIDYATNNGSATAGDDYMVTSGTLHFVDGDYSKTIIIPIIDDDRFEGDETFTLALSNPTGEVDLGSPNTTLITIADNEAVGRPILFTEGNTGRAIALDSVTFLRDPFSLFTTQNFSLDRQTRIILFASGIEVPAAGDDSAITAQAEHTDHRIYPLSIESIRAVPNFAGFTQIVVKLPNDPAFTGDVWINITVRGVASNRALVSTKPSSSTSP